MKNTNRQKIKQRVPLCKENQLACVVNVGKFLLLEYRMGLHRKQE